MLKWRLISFPLLVGILCFIFLAPYKYGYPVFAVAAVIAIPLAVFECARMLDKCGIGTMPISCGIFTAVLTAAFMFQRRLGFLFPILFVLLITLPWILVLVRREFAVEKVFGSVGTIVLVSIPYLALAAHFGSEKLNRLFFIILATKAMDTGGYIFGMLSGKLLPGGNHKLCPNVSPKKSWEGAIGGLILSLAVGWAFFALRNDMPLAKYLVFAAILAVASIFGDLTESALKRRCGVKDSGNWIPGMGGVLDVLDSFIYTAVACALFAFVAAFF